ncbi:Membrane protein involved in the export of O-antigen and teichoic acid [Frankia sp. AiPs1]|uniref:polysaccharide biosynthesis protein n=1 Tax=Frankia sp. AiPa1 TaxID=573492 RepID=UPI00202ADA1B|nr:polysaccharide biosynthesis protein [Frankia sp. AiPa1]MCL9758814.1 polysaccharide biosynthesis protein [Frankia sp. AiPa1]
MAKSSRAALAGLLAGPAALAVAGMLVNGCNLLMNLVTARVLDSDSYGAVSVQVSIFLILSVAGNALLIAVVQHETSGSGDTRREQWSWIRRLRGVCGIGIGIATVAALALARPVATLMSYDHPVAIAEATIGAALWTLLCVERGLIQARGAYQRLAVNFVVEGFVRIGLVILFVLCGMGVNGAGLGIVIGVLVGAEHGRWAVARTPRLPRQAPAAPTMPVHVDNSLPPATGPIPIPIPAPRPSARQSVIADTTVALGALVPLALLQNMDVVIVGWLGKSGVGGYAAISTACKVPVFIGLAVANFLLPEAARRRKEGRPAGGTLAVALAFVVAPGLLLATIGLVGAKWLIGLVFGPHLTGASDALWVLALSMTLLAVTLMFTTYLLGAGVRRVVGVLAVATVATTGALVSAGGGAMPTAVAALAAELLTAMAVGLLVVQLHHADRQEAAQRPQAPQRPQAADGGYPAPV